jgi:RNA polymerase sigma-70 factor (ECF subfamily)
VESKDIAIIFKEEYSNLVAVLFHYYNLQDLSLAEDLVSDTFIKAMKTWSHKGIPDSPKAWLRKTAKNLLVDYYRRQKTFDQKVAPNFQIEQDQKLTSDITTEVIEDSQLKMIFVVCDPSLNKEAQLCLALRILSGFSIEEIAKALFSNKEAINKKLYRAKKSIKLNRDHTFNLSKSAYVERLDNVLRVLYLIFNEGYYTSTNEQTIRHELCWEAMSLCKFLEDRFSQSNSRVTALMALMCFHASRLEARSEEENVIQLYDQQDRSRWNQQLIKKGESYLNKSATGNTVSKYHIEAAIAYWHTTDKPEKWSNILHLYNNLLLIEYSPQTAMSRTYALAKAKSAKIALEEALKLKLDDNQYYYCLIAELYRLDGDYKKEKSYLLKALELATRTHEKDLIQRKIKAAELA